METLACEWNSAFLLIFSENVGPLIYYSHLLPLIISLLVGGFVLLSDRKNLVNWALFFITLMFSAWVYFDLILWASPSPELVVFFWSSIVPVEMLIYAGCLYLVYLFANGKRDIPLKTKIMIAIFFIPIILFAHTKYNVLGLSPDCDEGAIEGPLIQYMYLVEIFFIGWITAVMIRGYRSLRDKQQQNQLLYIGIGTILFLLTFTAGNLTLVFSTGPLYEQYKLFGMPIFAAFVAYSVIRFRAFDVKVITAQVLVLALGVLVLSLAFFRSIENVRIVAVATFALVVILGYILVKNVRKEIEQREIIQKQEQELEVVNKQQENLLHFISHEIKGYLTKSEAGFAAITEGDYGAISEQLKTMSQAALADVRKGVRTVMEILDSSNMKKGTVGYKMQPFDFKAAVADVTKHLKQAADEKGLTIDVVISREGVYTLSGDEAKLRQHVIRNLVDNAIKYTPKGHIEVHLSDGDGKIRFSVKDNGVGITPEDMKNLFTEGGHGKDSIKINVHSTGYGLFIAKQVVDTHHGKIWAESEGAGKGSRFVVEFPAI